MKEKKKSCSDYLNATATSAERDISRRTFLQLLAAGAGVAFVHGCGSGSAPVNEAPRGSTANPIGAEPAGKEFRIAGAGTLKNGEALAFRLPDESAGIIFVTQNGELQALSAICTHAKCIVEWSAAENQIQCPCHGSQFDTNGKVLNGPALLPLPQFKVRKQGQDALVSVA